MSKNFCVIMAGGVGSRFWPLSRINQPKQFIDILNTGRSLLQMTFDRFKKIFPVENIFIVTSEGYKDIVLEHLPEIKPNQVLSEPYRRNTAPCLAYANYKIQSICPDANIVASPSDHLILNESEFIKTIQQGLSFVETNDALLTLGIKPNSPQTGYGYIQINSDIKVSEEILSLKKVKTFTEKPDLEMAKIFLESGEFYWNSGIFIWSLQSIIKSFERNLPEVDSLFKEGIELYNSVKEQNFIRDIYLSCKNISIDFGIMEKAENVYVLCSDFGWSDLGTWGSLYENSEKDNNANVILSDNTLTYKTKNCYVKIPKEKLVVLQGLEDFIIVETDDILLICKKEEEQQIRHFVNDVKVQKGEKYE
jgi:mannose-1-phosphate guanylyltransferase